MIGLRFESHQKNLEGRNGFEYCYQKGHIFGDPSVLYTKNL